jgi:hypothetical protein
MPRGRAALLAAAMLAASLGLLAGAALVGTDLLTALPALALALPLVAGRYVGEQRLARLARRVPHARRAATTVAPPPRPLRAEGPRGGLLIATGRARRGPPSALAAAR